MKIIIISIFISAFIVGNSFAIDSNECKAKQYDNKTFFTCLLNHTTDNKNSFGILNGLFGKSDIKIEIGNNIKYIQKMSNGYVNRCNINLSDKEKFLNDLRKWGEGSFGTSDLEYAKCSFKDESPIEDLLSKINIDNLKIIKEDISYKLLKGNNKGYLLNIPHMSIGGKKVKDFLCEITGSNGNGLRYIGDYLVDNINIYNDISTIDGNNGRSHCKINKVKLNENLDLHTLQDLGGSYYKDKNGIYYFGKGYNEKGEYLKILKLDNVDRKTFKIIDSFSEKAQDKNYIYKRGKIDTKRVKLIKKDNIIIDDFKIYNEKLTTLDQSKDGGRLYLSYKFDIKTNMEGEFMWKLNIGEGKYFSDKFVEGKSQLSYSFSMDRNTIKDLSIEIYNKDKAKFSFQDGEKIGTIKRKIKFTTGMNKPIFVNEEKELSNKNTNKKSVDLLLEKFDKKLSNKSLKSRLNIYKKLNFKITKLKNKYQNGKNKELINYLYESIHKNFVNTFKEYVLSNK